MSIHKKPFVLSIAGFDPSGGAGLLADIKTLESLKCYGLGVCTANTVQNDEVFKECHWIQAETVRSQINILFERFRIDIVKIGIVENWKVLNEMIDLLILENKDIKIVLDPILKSSSDYDFHQGSLRGLDEVLEKIFLITPNLDEIGQLFPELTEEETIVHIRSKTHLFLKGGHRTTEVGKDKLFTKEGKQYTFNPKLKNCTEKHGSGCVLSSAIAAHLALGFPLLKACFKGKRYTEKVLASNKTLLGHHRL